jgi:hypothetical protein
MDAQKRMFAFNGWTRDKVSATLTTIYKYIDGGERTYVDGLGNSYVTGSATFTASVLATAAKKVSFTFNGWSKHG